MHGLEQQVKPPEFYLIVVVCATDGTGVSGKAETCAET